MKESWRWFGPNDPVTINDIRQTGATDIVTALHHVPAGVTWPIEDIRNHQALIEDTPEGLSSLKWTVVESIPVHEDIKLGKSTTQSYIDAWIESMENLTFPLSKKKIDYIKSNKLNFILLDKYAFKVST